MNPAYCCSHNYESYDNFLVYNSMGYIKNVL